MSVPDIQNALRLLENEEVEAAISTLEATVDELPAHLPAQVLLARAYETNDQWEKALRTWENARFLMPNSPTVKVGRERALRHLDEDPAEPSGAPSEPKPDRTEEDATADARKEDDPKEDASKKDAGPEGDRPDGNRPEGVEPEAPHRRDTPSTAPSSKTSPKSSLESSPAPPAAGSPDEPADETTSPTDPSEDAPSAHESLQEEDSEDKDAEEELSDGGLPDGPTPDSFGSEGPSGLDELRQRAEQEARQGGSRPGLARQPSTPQPDEPETPDEDDPEADPETEDVTGDLDRLIRELESARIEPTPDPDDPEDEYPEPDLDDDIDDLVSETLARIYAGQEQYREAARIYVKLASQEPSRARHHLQNAAEMREKADAQEAAQAEETDGAQ
jgi:tetratricopeptide (TPR) repeat protein